jgi:ATP-dependent Clp endopeptidase proteolytic subunit ClpP
LTKFWSFKNIENEDSESLELRIEGEIKDDRNSWLYDWLGIPYASKNQLKDVLLENKDKDITVWIDSPGGSVFAAAGIYTLLKEHKGKVVAKIDGKAISAASMILMAADEKYISPVGQVMIHNPIPANGVFGDAEELRKVADVLDEIKETIVNAYIAGTGRPRDEIWEMMNQETWMSANTAVNEKFVDGVLYQDNDEEFNVKNIKDYEFKRLQIVNSMETSIKKMISIKSNEQAAENKSAEDNSQKEGDQEVEIKNLEDLVNAYPDLVKEAKNQAVEAERERIKNIDEIADNIDKELVNKAKFEDPMDAKDLAFEAMKSDKKKADQYLNDVQRDTEESGVDDVKAMAAEDKEDIENKEKTAKEAKGIADAVNKKRGIN